MFLSDIFCFDLQLSVFKILDVSVVDWKCVSLTVSNLILSIILSEPSPISLNLEQFVHSSNQFWVNHIMMRNKLVNFNLIYSLIICSVSYLNVAAAKDINCDVNYGIYCRIVSQDMNEEGEEFVFKGESATRHVDR